MVVKVSICIPESSGIIFGVSELFFFKTLYTYFMWRLEIQPLCNGMVKPSTLCGVCQVAQMNAAQLFDNGQDASARWVVLECCWDRDR